MSSGTLWFTLEELQLQFRRLGVTRAYFKWLAPNDNSKNQIYLGSDYSAINILPVGTVTASPTGKGGRAVFKAPIALWWLAPDGSLSQAPSAQVILYGQYPEIRLSGFLLGSKGAPSEVLAKRGEGRALFLGVTGDGRVIGHAAAAYDPITAQLPKRVDAENKVLLEFPLGHGESAVDSRARLLRELARVHRLGWIDSKRLDASGRILPCISQNCGGYTLEAELGVRPNGIGEPDFEGWEIKQHTVARFGSVAGVVTLITPEPDEGLYVSKGVEAFIRKYGYPDRRGRPDRLNVGGLHRHGTPDPRTRLRLEIRGFDRRTGKIVDAGGGICLIDRSDTIAAQWSFSKLIGHWKRKHARAAFVQSQRRLDPRRQYRYGSKVELGEDSDLARFLTAMCEGHVYYDPALKIVGASTPRPSVKRRNQFRIKTSRLPSLYGSFSSVDALGASSS